MGWRWNIRKELTFRIFIREKILSKESVGGDMFVYIHLFNPFLLSTYCVPGDGNTAVNRTDRSAHFWGADTPVGSGELTR